MMSFYVTNIQFLSFSRCLKKFSLHPSEQNLITPFFPPAIPTSSNADDRIQSQMGRDTSAKTKRKRDVKDMLGMRFGR